MRTFGGVLLGLALFFPGVILLRWLAVNVFGAYDALTVTDGCLVMIMILLSVNLVRRTESAASTSRATARSRRTATPAPPEPYQTDARFELLTGHSARERETEEPTPRRRREPTGRRRPSNRRER